MGGPCAKTAVLHPRIIASIIMMMVVMIIIMLIGIMMTMVTITVMIVVIIITDAQHPMPPGKNAALAWFPALGRKRASRKEFSRRVQGARKNFGTAVAPPASPSKCRGQLLNSTPPGFPTVGLLRKICARSDVQNQVCHPSG